MFQSLVALVSLAGGPVFSKALVPSPIVWDLDNSVRAGPCLWVKETEDSHHRRWSGKETR